MRGIFKYLILVIAFTACNSDSAWDCVKRSGALVQEQRVVEAFDKIDVRDDIQLIIKQENEPKVIVETGKNLLPKINVEVINGVLTLSNSNTCNLARSYGLTKVYVSASQLSEIRNGSFKTIESDGVLSFDTLLLISENFNIDGSIYTNGDFDMQLQLQELTIVANGLSNFYLSGTAQNAFIGLYSGNSRVEAAQLEVQELAVFHRSTNQMRVFPKQAIRGEIRSLGHVVSVFQPPIVEVETFYTGQLIFE